MTLLAPPPTTAPQVDEARALIEEARRLRRRRWLRGGAVAAILAGALGAAVTLVGGSTPRSRSVRSARLGALAGPARAVGGASPELPQALAVGPRGTLYAADEGRNQVLRLLPDGRFTVVAGDGRSGDTGDGGPALRARLALSHDSGLAVGPHSSLYVADPAHGRIREVEANGTIVNLVGGGRIVVGGRTRPIPARAARFPSSLGPSGLAFGPGGELYLSTGLGLFRLGADHALHWVLGPSSAKVTMKDGHESVSLAGASLQPIPGPGAVVAARGGRLLVAASGAPRPFSPARTGLYELGAHQHLRLVTPLPARWGAAAFDLAGGAVLAIDGIGLERVEANGHTSSLLPVGLTEAVRHHVVSFGGVAVGPGGEVFVDTYTWAGPRLAVAILRISPTGAVHVLWRS